MRRGRLARRVALLLLPGVLMMSGCWDRRDPDKMAWVTAIGVDRGPRNDFLFTFQIPGPQPSGGGGGAGRGRTQGAAIDVFAVEAPDIVTGMDTSQSFVARRIDLSQAKALIIGEQVSREGVEAITGAGTRFEQFRRNMTVMVARGSAYDFLRKAVPRLETNSARWFELIALTQAQTGIVPQTRLHDFVIEAETMGVGARAALVATRPDIAAGTADLTPGGRGESESRTPPPAGSATAGDVRRLQELPVEFMGLAVFKGTRLAGYLTGDESRFVSMLRGEFRQAAMAFVDPADPTRRVALRIKPHRHPQLKVRRSGQRVEAHFVVSLDAELISVQTPVDYIRTDKGDQLEAAVSRQLQERIANLLRKTLHDWGTDLYHITNSLRPTFATLDQWEAFDWGHRVVRTVYSIEVSVQLRRYGLQMEQAIPKE